MIGMTERQFLREWGLKFKHGPEPLDHLLRFQFWLEYHRSQGEDATRPKINMTYVIGHSISKENFYRFYITDPMRLAFMLRPPVEYVAALRAALTHSVHVIEDVLERGRTENVLEFAPIALKIFESLHKKLDKFQDVGEPVGGRGRDEKVPDLPPPGPVGLTKEQKLKALEEVKSRIAVSAPEPDLEQV